MQSQPEGDLKWILVYQDHLTKFIQLRPIKSKCAPEIAYQLLYMFSIFEAPSILQSDNGRKSVITDLSEMGAGLKLVLGKPRHSQSQESIEQANRDIEDMSTTWLQSNSIIHWDGGLRFVQVMKNRAFHQGIKCSPCEAMFGQPMKVGLKTSNLPDDATDDIFTKEELEKVVSGEHGNEQNILPEDPVADIHVETPNGTRNDLVDDADMEGPVLVDVN